MSEQDPAPPTPEQIQADLTRLRKELDELAERAARLRTSAKPASPGDDKAGHSVWDDRK